MFGDTARDLHTHIFEAILPGVYYFPAFVTVISLTFDCDVRYVLYIVLDLICCKMVQKGVLTHIYKKIPILLICSPKRAKTQKSN